MTKEEIRNWIEEIIISRKPYTSNWEQGYLDALEAVRAKMLTCAEPPLNEVKESILNNLTPIEAIELMEWIKESIAISFV